MNEQLNIVIGKGDYGGPVRSPDIRAQIPSWALQRLRSLFALPDQDGVRGYVQVGQGTCREPRAFGYSRRGADANARPGTCGRRIDRRDAVTQAPRFACGTTCHTHRTRRASHHTARAAPKRCPNWRSWATAPEPPGGNTQTSARDHRAARARCSNQFYLYEKGTAKDPAFDAMSLISISRRCWCSSAVVHYGSMFTAVWRG